jgi:prephenate dehydratase
MNKSLILGVSGDAGSFSEEAGLLYAKTNNISSTLDYLLDMEGVLAAVENGTVDIGIFPVVNLNGGLVRMAFDAMAQHKFKVIDELWLDVHQCLLVKPGITMHQIQNIVSHSQALAQCRHYLRNNFNNVQLIEWQDTARAANELSLDILPPFSAVIAPERAASLYGLEVAARNIQDSSPNLTAFLIVKR